MPRYRTKPCPVFEVTAERVELPHGGTVWDVTDSEGNTVRYSSVAFGMTFEPVPDDAPADAPPAAAMSNPERYAAVWSFAQWLSVQKRIGSTHSLVSYWHDLASEFIAKHQADTATQAER